MPPPERDDVRVIGLCCVHIESIVAQRTTARAIQITDGVIAHYRQKHAGQFDVDHAEARMADIVGNPLRVYQGRKQSTLAFVETFAEQYFVIVPVKCLPTELWVETLFISRQDEFESRRWVKRGLLYQRNERRE